MGHSLGRIPQDAWRQGVCRAGACETDHLAPPRCQTSCLALAALGPFHQHAPFSSPLPPPNTHHHHTHTHTQVHWFSILNSLMVVVVMSAIVAMIMMRTVRRDLQRYEQLLVDAGESAPPPSPHTPKTPILRLPPTRAPVRLPTHQLAYFFLMSVCVL